MDLPPYLSPADLDALIARALDEDVGHGDVTTLATVGAEVRAEGRFLAKASGVVAGLAVAERVFAQLDESVQVSFDVDDGARVEAGTVFGRAAGPARSLLVGERLALNLMQRMSGIATATRRMAEATGDYPARILDTRKTAPGLRALDKWAVLLGGGENHRVGLYDMVLVKDNHIAAAGGVAEAILAARRYVESAGLDVLVEVEARTLEEIEAVLAAGGVDRILLDNFVRVAPGGTVDTSGLEEALALVGGRIPCEASGNVTLQTVPAIAATGVDYISSGALTHSVEALDISLKLRLA
jgi:nicotinate-nucleotide pyrophosphorylase (carboxylating)